MLDATTSIAMRGRRHKKTYSENKGTFDPSDTTNVKHTKIGVWDLYEDVQSELAKLPGASTLEKWMQAQHDSPYVWRMIRDIGSIRSCWILLVGFVVVEVVSSLLPAITLWYSGQLLEIIQIAVDRRTVDFNWLFSVTTARLICSLLQRIFEHINYRLTVPLNIRIKHHYDVHMFHAVSRLDVPTFDDMAVQRQIEQALSGGPSSSSVAWSLVSKVAKLGGMMVQLVSQVGVLVKVLGGQRDGYLLAVLSFGQAIFRWTNRKTPYVEAGVWAATSKNEDYIQSEGLKLLVGNGSHRKELVAGNLWPYLLSQYAIRIQRLGDRAGNFWETLRQHRSRDRLTISSIAQEVLGELPQIIFTLRAAQSPSSIPVSVASLNLITNTSGSFMRALFGIFNETGSLMEDIASVRRLYGLTLIPNKIANGTQPYPENQQSLAQGIAIEFRNISFRYPDSDAWALENVSFRLDSGQLCVIVGINGSGKSTILKLIARIYEPTEGQILIDGQDISTLKLEDLRKAIAVLFQDYTYFPLSIADNIALGNPELAEDPDKIREAARLGGAEEFVDKLPERFGTYLERPVKDHYSALPEGTNSLFGRPINYKPMRQMGGMSTSSKALSGGEMQRIALSRTFMRSLLSSGANVGLLLFDEPSASLDPTAEHDLFLRLRQLRGNKTMVFSSHRFGNLTRHADLILYMHGSRIIEEGTHEELLKRGGEYAQVWHLQAQAFLP